MNKPIPFQPAQPRFICPLKTQDELRARLAGGKATALARLAQAGLLVPDGFCILTSAHDLAAQCQDADIQAIPDPVWSEIAAAYETLLSQGAGAVAVRSSATGEDGAQASFAGQYLSRLDVHGLDALYRAVLDSWNSSRAQAARAYAGAHGSQGPARMAVIVQRMVAADASGVLFTANPASGNPRQMVVEIAPGAAGVEQGRVTPARLVLEKPGGRVNRRLSSDAAKWTARLPLRGLARAGQKIEALFGAAQDIEWAVADGRLWILQSRPITALPGGREVWSRANAGEILPGVVTPLSWSVFQPVLRRAGWHSGRNPLTLHWRWRLPAGNWADSPRLFDGRAYMELRSVYASFAGFPGVDAQVLHSALGFEFDLLDPQELPERRPRWHPVDLYRWARFWAEMLGVTRSLRAARRRLAQPSARLTALDPAEMDAPALLRHSAALQEQAARSLGLHITCTALAFSAYGLLLRQLRQHHTPDALLRLEKRLTAGAQEMSTARHMRAIQEMARAVDSCPEARAVLRDHPLTQVSALWRACPNAGEVTRRWEAFLREFGGRGTQEFELAVPRWEEDPTVILTAVREAVLHTRPSTAQALPDIAAQIRCAGWLARRFYMVYTRLVPLRENLKHDVASLFYALRRVHIRLGEILAQSGYLSCQEDVFFLEQGEICQETEPPRLENAKNAKKFIFASSRLRDSSRKVETGEPSKASNLKDLAQIAATRKMAHQHYQSSECTPVFARCDGAITPLTLQNAGDGAVLTGIGCSGGIVTAPVALLRALDGSQNIPSGRILVAPSIDPGLTPLLLNAAGLVTETGGMLSHGATLAREFGLPAVVSVPGITRAVQDGQIVGLDGSTGRVILSPGPRGEQP